MATPNTPSNFTVSPGPEIGQVTLAWDIDEIPGVIITDYVIRITDGATTRSIPTPTIARKLILGAGDNLVPGTLYGFEVRANAGYYFSSYTDPPIQIAPPGQDQFPNAPSLAVPTSQPGSGQVSLSWTIVPKSGVIITGYMIDGTNLTASTPLNQFDAGLSLSAVLGFGDGIVSGNSYEFVVRAIAGPLSGPVSTTQTVNTTAVTVPCYARGTLILTDKGYTKIEDIKKGDKVVREGCISKKGVLEKNKIKEVPVTWVSKFKIETLDSLSRPICISKNAFGEDRPFENLYVSPGHSIMIDDRLITAKNLRNGDTIYPYDECESVEYYHLQCEAHSAIYANGVLSETYIEWRKEFFDVINYLE